MRRTESVTAGREERKSRGQRWGSATWSRKVFPQKGDPKWSAQKEESPGPVQGIRAETHRTQTHIPETTMKEAGETAQVTSVLSSIGNHGMILKGFDHGSNKIRGYFRKMNGGEGKDWWEQRKCEAGRCLGSIWLEEVGSSRQEQTKHRLEDTISLWLGHMLPWLKFWNGFASQACKILYMPFTACSPPTPRLRRLLKRCQVSRYPVIFPKIA